MNTNNRIITRKNKIFITGKPPKYVVNWYHMYLVHPVLNQIEEGIYQHLYWNRIMEDIWKKLKNCDNYQHKKTANKKNAELTAKSSE